MNRAVMISIHSKWVEKIANGEKTIEVRKTAPKCGTPFKCYIYETKAGGGRGKVIGEFVCDRIFNINDWIYADKVAHILTGRSVETNTPIKNICLSYKELEEYLNGKDGYGWHISKLKIYDQPKELRKFNKPCITPKMPYCPFCEFGLITLSEDEEEYAMYHGGRYETCEWHCLNRLRRPFQSWGYVEV